MSAAIASITFGPFPGSEPGSTLYVTASYDGHERSVGLGRFDARGELEPYNHRGPGCVDLIADNTPLGIAEIVTIWETLELLSLTAQGMVRA